MLVQKGALLNCVDKTWSSLLCILALSTVTLTIFFFFLILAKSVKLLFNSLIKPRPGASSCRYLHILFCVQGIDVKCSKSFKANHFVPIGFGSRGTKRKISAVVKQNSCQKKYS